MRAHADEACALTDAAAPHQVVLARCMVDTFSVLVTAPVTRKVQGPMTTTWHTPPPAPAARPAMKGDAPPASSESLIFSLLYLRRARRRHAPAARQPRAHAARKKQPRVTCVCVHMPQARKRM